VPPLPSGTAAVFYISVADYLPELLTRGAFLNAIRQAGADVQSQIPAPIPTGKFGG
jgi:hypothetical protein